MSLSDFSDLTDMSSEEDEPLQKRVSKAKKGPKEYKINHVLRAPRTAQYTAKSLYDQIIDDAINLDPEYQREVVWHEEKQSGLIDSILRNYYIPPIIFAVTVQDDGSELRTCIDGKQRLTSIQRFIDGQIPHKDSFTGEKLWYKPSATNARRKLLPPHLRTQFANKQIVCVEYTGLNEDQEREIFQRVQLGVALTPAERLQALVGPWSTVIREIQSQVLGEEGFEGYLDWGHARGRDFQCLATIGYLIENHPKTTVPGTKTLEKWLQKTQPVSTQLRADLHETFRIFVTLARGKKYSGSLNRPSRVSPIEFIMIGVLIYLKRQTLSLTQISSAIEKMRKDVRASHQDIRSNTRVTKHLMEFMAKKIKVSELKSDGEGDKPATLVIAKAAKPAKRKRPIESDDELEEEPPSKSKPAKSSNTQGSKAAKQAVASSTPKTNGTKKVSLTVPASKPVTSSRMTNNSMSSLAAPIENLPLHIPANSSPRRQSPAQAPSSSNIQDGPLGSTISNNSLPAKPTTLTVQTGPSIKVESPQMAHMKSPSFLSSTDRLAPIRAAKEALGLGSSQSPIVNRPDEVRAAPSAVSNWTSDPPRNSAVGPVSSQQQPSPIQTSALSQQLSLTPDQLSSMDHAQVQGILQAIRLQYPSLTIPAQGPNNDAVNVVSLGQHSQSTSSVGNVAPNSSSGRVANGTPTNLPHNGVSQSSYQGGSMSSAGNSFQSNQMHMNQVHGHSLPPRPVNGLPGPPDLPQRPTASMRAEPLGAPSRPSPSFSNDRRGSYGSDRHHPPDDRRPVRHDHDKSRDWDRRAANYGRKDSWAHDRTRDAGWGARGRGGYRG